MEKKIEDYLHLYLGCEARIVSIDEQLTCYQDSRWFGHNVHDIIKLDLTVLMCVRDKVIEVKPILRPVSGMTAEESATKQEICSGIMDVYKGAELTRYLLSEHFDLFNLIPDRLAIDATL